MLRAWGYTAIRPRRGTFAAKLEGESMSDITPVIFRKFPEGDIIALFPAEPGDMSPYTCASFQHVGQHGAASVELVRDTKAAKPAEYADLKRELESAPYRYRLKVYKRWQPHFDRDRKA